VPTIVRQQALLLALGLGAGIVSATAGSLVQAALHLDGQLVFFPLFAVLFGLILRFGPQSWR
jgi:hypothetical protein